jgi:hypothetical protein
MLWNNATLSSSNSIVDTLDFLTKQFLPNFSLALLIIGVIGFIGNAFTFLQPALRRNSFCIYSLCGSLVDVLSLFTNLLPLYLAKTPGLLLSSMSASVQCKFMIFILSFLPHLSLNLLILSMIDRYACTCPLTSSIRCVRQLKKVPWFIIFTVFVTFLLTICVCIFYDIIPGIGCSSRNPLLNGILYIVIQGILTPLVMLVFVWLSYRNIKQSRRRVVSE